MIDHQTPSGFFDTQMRRSRLAIAAPAWLGTRFVAHGNKRGAGVDCVHLCAEIYLECGLFEAYEFPKYTLDAGAHRDTSMTLEWIVRSGRFQSVTTPQAGDLVVFKFKKVAHHVGLMLTSQLFVHIMERRQVETALIDDPTFKHALSHVYRPMEAA